MSEKLLIVPAYNEEKRIKTILTESNKYPFDYLFYCDGNDSTVKTIWDYYKANPPMEDSEIFVIEQSERYGKGGALMASAYILEDFGKKYKYIGYADADGSASLQQMNVLFNLLENSTLDGVIGSRWMDNSISVKQSSSRRIYSRLLNIITRTAFSLPYADTQCGAKAFKSDVFIKTAQECETTGFGFDVELLWRMLKNGLSIQEVGIIWKDNPKESKIGLFTSLQIARELFGVRFLSR
jgi:glycosyltransferase involved in cell wall biosynthesis